MRQINLTEGVIWKTLLRFALPVVLSSLLQSAYSLVDLVLAGHYVGKTGMSAINNSGQIIMLVTQIIIGVTIGANVLIGQFYGAKDEAARKQTNLTLFSVTLIAGFVMALVLFFFGGAFLRFMGAPALQEATVYLRICALGLLPVFGYNALSASIRGVGNSKQPLYFILVTALVNVLLDLLFMGPLSMGVAGAAWATLIAQTISFLCALVYVLRHRALYGLGQERLCIRADKLRLILKLGIPSAIQMTLVGISWLTMTFLINGYGIEASAASGIAAKLKDLAQLFALAMGSAASTMVAQCLGAGAFDRASRTVHIAMRISIAASVLIIIGIELFAPQLVMIFKPDAETAYWAVKNLRIEILAQVFFASFLVYNALPMGAGHTGFVLFSSIMNSIIVRLILAAIFNHYFGLVGIYWACMLAPASSVPLGYLYERSGKWKRSLAK